MRAIGTQRNTSLPASKIGVTQNAPVKRVIGMEERVCGGPDMEFRSGEPAIWPLRDFDAFYQREFDSVAALAYVLSGSRLASDDLAQEAFLAAYRRWGEIGRYDDPGAWVRRVVANRSVSLLRRSFSRTKALIRLGERLEPAPEMSPDTVDVWRAIRRLPRRQAQATALYYLDDLSLDDVAAVLDCSVETVRTHLRRARKALARSLDE
jgi:RNA polymerase sigma-70 factor (ECF subfamily)